MKIKFAAIVIVSGQPKDHKHVKVRPDGKIEALFIYDGNDRSTYESVKKGLARMCRRSGCRLEEILQIHQFAGGRKK